MVFFNLTKIYAICSEMKFFLFAFGLVLLSTAFANEEKKIDKLQIGIKQRAENCEVKSK